MRTPAYHETVEDMISSIIVSLSLLALQQKLRSNLKGASRHHHRMYCHVRLVSSWQMIPAMGSICKAFGNWETTLET
jgi:hypothetical protein